MSRQLGIQFKNLNTITETGLLASMTVDIEQILNSLTELVVRNLDFNRGMVMLCEKEPPGIKYASGYGYTKNQLEKLERCIFPLDNAESREYFVQAFQRQKPLMVNDVSETQTALSEGAMQYARQMKVRAFVSAPIIYKSEALGLILLENPRSEREVTRADLNLLIGMAAHIAGSIFNALTIQELNQKESALLRSHLELESRVKERTKELSGLNRDLQNEIIQRQQVEKELRCAKEMSDKANQAKSDFLANMSHELRTPLNHIIGFTELVLDKNFGELNDTQAEYLTDVHTSSKHLLSLINDILDLSKVEAGKQELQLKDVDLKMLLENSLVMVKEKYLKHAIQTSVDTKGIPDTIKADERMLKQIIYNLLSNAVKFSPDGGKVSLTARPCVLHESDHSTNNGDRKQGVKICVSDTGIGLKPQDLDYIFNPFDQVENSLSRRFQGTGLGLSLTKNLVELHNGRIWAQSEGEGKGSTFSFIIPV
jgi:signal transduction histidine kinase